ncbi:MAG: DNA-3-methyladenine glycosylase I [Nannocystaceae bacterium]|nr:DNA-3-methyladenine glycosylase I [Nannocystaceae bacterium]
MAGPRTAAPTAPSRPRCRWCLGKDPTRSDPVMVAYHDHEWGVPLHDDRKHFEFMLLDAFQAGLSWAIVLAKRAGFRKAFADFDPAAIARFNQRSVERLVADPGIVRNRQKIEATIGNARAFLALQAEFGSFDRWIWDFVGGAPQANAWPSMAHVPPRTAQSDAMSKALQARGFKFVGSTICYAYMQAAGMVNDHEVGCFRHAELTGGSSPAAPRPRRPRASR